MTTPLTVWISGIGFLAPGLSGWRAASDCFNGNAAYIEAPTVLPAPSILPPAERRRASRVVRLALALGLEAAEHANMDPSTLATVFSASGADGHNCHALCEQLATDDRQISPTRFHNSVHNAAAGYWGIATRAMAPCQVIAAFDASFGAGLLDAISQVITSAEPLLFIAYDSEYPEPLFSKRDTPDCAGAAFIFTPQKTSSSIASITINNTTNAADKLADPVMENLRQKIPAMRGLPLLIALAQSRNAIVCLDYLPPMQLQVELNIC